MYWLNFGYLLLLWICQKWEGNVIFSDRFHSYFIPLKFEEIIPATTSIVTEFGNIEEPTPKSTEKLMFDYKKCISKISEKRLNNMNIIFKLFGTFYIKNIESTLDRCHRSPHGG